MGLTPEQKKKFSQSIPALGMDGTGKSAGDVIDSLFRLGGVQVSYTTNGTAATEDIVTHTLGRVPVGYVMIRNSNGGDVYDSTVGSWSATQIRLKCQTAANSVTLYVF